MAVECDTAAHLQPENSGWGRAHQNLCRKQFQVDALRVKLAGHSEGGVVGARAWQDCVTEQKSSQEYDKGCYEYSEAADVFKTQRSSRVTQKPLLMSSWNQ